MSLRKRTTVTEPPYETAFLEAAEIVSARPGRAIRAVLEHPLIDVTWSSYKPGARGPELHVHHRHADVFFVVDGELQFRLGQQFEPLFAPAGTFVLVPPNVAHAFANDGTSTARWLNFHAPSAGFLTYLRGEHPGFDQHVPPTNGGGNRSDATVTRACGRDWLQHKGQRFRILGSAPQLTTAEIDIEPGFENRPDRRANVVELFFVLGGEIELALDDRLVRALPGSWAFAPPGALRCYRNAGPAPARILNVRAPSSAVRPIPHTFSSS